VAVILGIDTSCDDTSVAISHDREVLANVVASQNQIHKQFGGVFPTLAKQAHRENFPACLALALRQAQLTWSDIDGIAVTYGPGLAPALEVGIQFARQLALEHHKPVLAINHIEGHALSAFALAKGHQPEIEELWPKLAIVISGGHSEFIQIHAFGHYQILGQTLDDAAGECLDKVGRMLNLGYPAGPLIETFAKRGNPLRFPFPLPLTDRADFQLSFSGLKTAARQLIEKLESEQKLDAGATADIAAGIQRAVIQHIQYKLLRILLSSNPAQGIYPDHKTIKKRKQQSLLGKQVELPGEKFQEVLLGGGVAANAALRRGIRQTLSEYHKLGGPVLKLRTPYRKKLCSDNAAMIAVAGSWHFQNQEFVDPEKIDRQPQLVLE
jgi:N6-L-threonylcarbamoyladenine synthase